MLKLRIQRECYFNGNYVVHYVDVGGKTKRCLRVGETFEPDFPDSIDIKITNQCSNGCPYCHESSCPDGKWFDMGKTLALLQKLSNDTGSPGIELAIGGGNVLEDVDKTYQFVSKVTAMGFRPCITVKLRDFIKHAERCRDAGYPRNTFMKLCGEVYGIGISIDRCLTEEEDALIDDVSRHAILRNVVYHVIIGVMPINELLSMTLRVSKRIEKFTAERNRLNKIENKTPDEEAMSEKIYQESSRISDAVSNANNYLILGFKKFGRASDTDLDPAVVDEWRKYLRRVILGLRKSKRSAGEASFTNSPSDETNFLFDNLALEQLNLKTALLSAEYDKMFFGDEFSCSMYIDAVEETFAPTSRDPERTKWSDIDLLSYFKNGKSIFRREK